MNRSPLLAFLALPLFAVAQPTQSQTVPTTGADAATANAGPTKSSGPTDSKAKQTYANALKLAKARDYVFALDDFRKADKQDGGHCIPCEIQAYKTAAQLNDYKAERDEATALLANVTNVADKAQAHYMAGQACLTEGIRNNHEKPLQAADGEFKAALELQPGKSNCLYGDGMALAHLKQDGEARERFQQFLKQISPNDVDYARAQRFAEHPEMARARVAPNFQLTALDGKTLTLESLAGKVVLIDFWATWCGPCREALPCMQQIAKKFDGQPLVVLSISLDKDDAKWKEFVASHNMTWVQYRDGSQGRIADLFGVHEIPSTFTIDADGVLQDQHVGDAEIEGKLKKLVTRASEVVSKRTVAEVR